jgi:hypothetical protein
MRTTHTFGLQFIIRSNKNDQNSGIIYVRITIEGQRAEISLKKHYLSRFGTMQEGK